jgi:hypothetical protein
VDRASLCFGNKGLIVGVNRVERLGAPRGLPIGAVFELGAAARIFCPAFGLQPTGSGFVV